jgi:hypothetical protein
MARFRAQKHHNVEHELNKRKRHIERLHTLSPQELRALQEQAAEERRARVSSGLVPLLAFLLTLPALEGVLLLSPSVPPRSAAALALLPPLLLHVALRASPLARLAAPWAALSTALALLRGACALWPTGCGGRVSFAFGIALHAARVLLVLLRVPDATRRTWRFLRGVDEEPLRPISVRLVPWTRFQSTHVFAPSEFPLTCPPLSQDKARVEAFKAARAARTHADLVADTEVPRALALLNPYAVLDVPRDAANEDIRRAWRAISLACHPDKVAQRRPAVPPAEAERLVARFHAAKHAYEALGEPSARAAYDAAVLRVQHGLRAAAFARKAVSQAVSVEALRTVETRNATLLRNADVRRALLWSAALQPVLCGATWFVAHAAAQGEAGIAALFATGAAWALWLVVHCWTELCERTLKASLTGPTARYNALRALCASLEARLALSDPELDPDEAAQLRTRREAQRRGAPAGGMHSRAWDDADGDMSGALIIRCDGSFTAPPELPMRPRQASRAVNEDGSVTYELTWRPQWGVQGFLLCTYNTDGARRILWQGRGTRARLHMPPPTPGATRCEVLYPRLVAINAAGESCASVPCSLRGAPPEAVAARAPSPPPRSPEEREAETTAARLRDEAHAARHSGRIHRVSAALAALQDVSAAAAAGDAKSAAVVACMTDLGRLVALLTAAKHDVEAELALQRERARRNAEEAAARAAAAEAASARQAAPPQTAKPQRRAPAAAAAAAPAPAPAVAALPPQAPPQAAKPVPPPVTQVGAGQGLSRRQRQRQRQQVVPSQQQPAAAAPPPVPKPLQPPPVAPHQPRAPLPWPQPAPQRSQLTPPPLEDAMLVPPFFALPVLLPVPLPMPLPLPAEEPTVILPPYVPPPNAPPPPRQHAPQQYAPPPPPPPPQQQQQPPLPLPLPLPAEAPACAPPAERDEKHLCVACFESERDAVLLPCKHLCLCSPCVAVMAGFYQRSPAAGAAGAAAALFHCPLCQAPVLDVLTGLYT